MRGRGVGGCEYRHVLQKEGCCRLWLEIYAIYVFLNRAPFMQIPNIVE